MLQPIIEIILSELKVPFTPLYLRQIFANPLSQEIPIETAKEIVDELIRHDKWTAKALISSTPTILIDGKPLPAGYTVEDLIYHLSKKRGHVPH